LIGRALATGLAVFGGLTSWTFPQFGQDVTLAL